MTSNGEPGPLMDGALNSYEGTSCMSDFYGDILFYSDGKKVWDKNHNQMPNSLTTSIGGELFGNLSSSQSSLIVPKPGSSNIYYLFTVDANLNSHGLCYSKIDMSLNSGYGDVDFAEKNLQLFTPCPEKITATMHSNGYDIWVLAHEWGSNNFRAYLVGNAGISLTSYVLSSVGTVHSGASSESRGIMKFSPTGTKLVCVREGSDLIELFDFNKSTGMLSNPVSLTNSSIESPYGAEFSADERYLYGTTRWDSMIIQYDLYVPQNQIVNNYFIIQTGAEMGQLQLAVDSKIYAARTNTKYLGRINYPQSGGNLSNYEDTAILLGPDYSSARFCREGLPNFMSPGFPVPLPIELPETNCSDLSVNLYITSNWNSDSIQWNFNYPDTSEVYHHTSTNDTITYFYLQSGVYDIQYINYFNGITDTFMTTIYQSTTPVFDLGPNFVLCENDTLHFDFSYLNTYSSIGNANFLWTATISSITLMDTSSVYHITKPGNYKLYVFGDSICGSYTDSFQVLFNGVDADLGNDNLQAGCSGVDNYLLDAGYTNTNFGVTSYVWSDQSTNSTLLVDQSGWYWVTLSLGNCVASDSIQIAFELPLSNNILGNDTTVCPGYMLEIESQVNSIVWSNGETSSSILINESGIYSVEISNSCGVVSDSTSLYIPQIIPDFQDIEVLCEGSFIQLDAGSAGTSYSWSTGEPTEVVNISVEGIYSVTVSNDCFTDSFYVDVKRYSNVLNLGDDQVICLGENAVFSANLESYPFASFLWSTGETTESIESGLTGIYKLTLTSTECPQLEDSVLLTVNNPQVNFNMDTLFVVTYPALLQPVISNATSYIWSDNSTDSTLMVNNDGIYSITVMDEIDCFGIDSIWVQIYSHTFTNSNPPVIRIYPNPASDWLIVDQLKPNSSIEIYNRSGELVHTQISSGSMAKVNIKNLPQGLYILKVQLDQVTAALIFEVMR